MVVRIEFYDFYEAQGYPKILRRNHRFCKGFRKIMWNEGVLGNTAFLRTVFLQFLFRIFPPLFQIIFWNSCVLLFCSPPFMGICFDWILP